MKPFNEFYEELQSQDNNELNNLWQEAKKENERAKKVAGIICLVVDILIVNTFLKIFTNSGIYLFLLYMLIFITIIDVVIFVGVTAITGSGKKNKQFNTKYKRTVINKLMNNFYDNLEYFPDKEMPEYIYEKLGYENYDNYISDDYFEALINNKNSVQMAEILTQEEEIYTDSDGNIQTRIITKFHGLFAKIELDKSINNELRIGQNGTFAFSKRLKMDSSEFEKYFDVKASNQIVGMQLLTADVMEELVDFENKTNMKFDICIKDNELYLRFQSGAMFEAPNIKKGALDKDSIKKYFYMLNFTYNLSNRIISVVNETEI